MKKFKWLIIDLIVIAIIVGFVVLIEIFGKWDWKWSTILLITIYFFNVCFITFSVTNKDQGTEKLAWIFFMVFFPIVGHVFYTLFRLRRYGFLNKDDFEKEFDNFKINSNNNQSSINNNLANWQSKLVNRNFYQTNLEIFKHGYEAFNHLLNDLKKAKKYIHIEMYILKNSEIYEKIKKILFEKVKEGIEVKIIFDRFGSWKVPIDEFKHLKKNGIDLCFFNVPYYPYVRYTDNRRLHRKFFIIDNEVVHFGGLNISDEYCSFSSKYGYWQDSNFSATGKIVADYESVFLYDWYKITGKTLNKNNYLNNKIITNPNSSILTFEESPKKTSSYLEDSIDFWINNSNNEIKIATPYFIPTERIMNSFKNALKRGVNIELFIPGKPDKKFTYQATLYYANELAKYGANIFIYENVFLHSKFGTFDNEYAYIGTNNIDMRSFFTNEESICLIFGKQVIKSLNNIFDEYKERSKKTVYSKQYFLALKHFIFKLVASLM